MTAPASPPEPACNCNASDSRPHDSWCAIYAYRVNALAGVFPPEPAAAPATRKEVMPSESGRLNDPNFPDAVTGGAHPSNAPALPADSDTAKLVERVRKAGLTGTYPEASDCCLEAATALSHQAQEIRGNLMLLKDAEARIEELERENAEYRDGEYGVNRLAERVARAEIERDALAAENEALRGDAARYRYIGGGRWEKQ
jgi:hypothetical protein